MPLSPHDRDIANLAAASRLDADLQTIANLAPGFGYRVGLLVSGMTVYGRAVSPVEVAKAIDAEHARGITRGRAAGGEHWDEVALKMEGALTKQAEKKERERQELIERNPPASDGEMSEEDARRSIRDNATTLNLVDAHVYTGGGLHYTVPLMTVQLSHAAAWWLLPSDEHGNASFSHPVGRWGAPGAYSVIYLGRPTSSVIVEAYRHLVDDDLDNELAGHMVGPRNLLSCDVAVSDILDLRDPRSQVRVGLNIEALRSPVDEYAACQRVGQAAHQLDLHGIIAPAASAMGETLALFEEKLAPEELPRLTATEHWEHLPQDPRRLRLVDEGETA
jgi:hypothetical protein